MFTVSPVDVRIVADEQPLTAQRKYDLVCEAIGSRPHAKLTWWKNNSRLEKTKDSVSGVNDVTHFFQYQCIILWAFVKIQRTIICYFKLSSRMGNTRQLVGTKWKIDGIWKYLDINILKVFWLKMKNNECWRWIEVF